MVLISCSPKPHRIIIPAILHRASCSLNQLGNGSLCTNALHSSIAALTCDIETIDTYTEPVTFVHTIQCLPRVHISDHGYEAVVAQIRRILIISEQTQTKPINAYRK